MNAYPRRGSIRSPSRTRPRLPFLDVALHPQPLVLPLQTQQLDSASVVSPALGLTIGGIPAVLIAAFIVRSLPLNVMRWLVVVVVLYAAVAMLRSAVQERRKAS